MKPYLTLISATALTACASLTGETSISDQLTDEPIRIPLAQAQSASGNDFAVLDDNLTVRHERDDRLQPFQRIEKANKAAKIEPGLENYVNAVQVYPYTEGALYQLYTAPGQVSLVSLQKGEELVSVSAGDTARWMVGDTASGSGATRQVSIIVKPVSAGLNTNLVISTNKRTYLLGLKSFRETYMAALSWAYPHEDALAEARMVASSTRQTQFRELDPDAVSFSYVISGSRAAWRPIRVFDDGRKTYVEFPPRVDTSETPPLFIVGASSEPELVNYRVRGHFYIVDRLFDKAELRIGGKSQSVVTIARKETSDDS